VLSVLEKRDDISPVLERPLKELVARLTKHRPPGRPPRGRYVRRGSRRGPRPQ
jgi:hypothetical protein